MNVPISINSVLTLEAAARLRADLERTNLLGKNSGGSELLGEIAAQIDVELDALEAEQRARKAGGHV